jgi:ubiquinone/menaquinone biosynthesis C-methylase UbiE
MDKEIGAAFDAVAEAYDDNLEHAQIAGALVGLIEPAEAELIVDVATGTGAAAFAALKALVPTRIIAIDVSAGMLDVARRRAVAEDPDQRIEWMLCSAVPLPIDDDSADLVLCASSLHFLGRGALPDWYRVLRRGGQAAFSLPAKSSFSPSPHFRRLLPGTGLRLPASADDAKRLLESTGLRLRYAVNIQVGGRRVVLVVAAKDAVPAHSTGPTAV